MKKIKSLGKPLSKEEQKKISGGLYNGTLYCTASEGGPYYLVGEFGNLQDCYTQLNYYCQATPQPYACYCTPANQPAICNL